MSELNLTDFTETKVVKLDEHFINPPGWLILETFFNDYVMPTYEDKVDPNNIYGNIGQRQTGGEVISQTFALIGRRESQTLEALLTELAAAKQTRSDNAIALDRARAINAQIEKELTQAKASVREHEESSFARVRRMNENQQRLLALEGQLNKLKAALGEIRMAEILGEAPKFGEPA